MSKQTTKTSDELLRNAAAAGVTLALIVAGHCVRHVGAVMPPLSLTDAQLTMIKSAAKSVAIDRRDEFLRNVASHLGVEPSDQAVQAAIDAQLAVGRLPVFLCDSKEGQRK
jgi:hypothetical protein